MVHGQIRSGVIDEDDDFQLMIGGDEDGAENETLLPGLWLMRVLVISPNLAICGSALDALRSDAGLAGLGPTPILADLKGDLPSSVIQR